VVGGSSGIGLAIAQAFAQHGAKVRITGLDDAELSLPQAARFERSRLDVSDAAAAARTVGELDALDGPISRPSMAVPSSSRSVRSRCGSSRFRP